MFIPDPDFYPSQIPDPKTVTKVRGEKKVGITLFFVVTNFRKLNFMLFLKRLRKNFGPIFKELLKFLPKKFSICSQIFRFGIRDPRSGIGDPGSGKNLFRFPDPRSMGQKGTGSRIRIRNTGSICICTW